MIGYEIGSGYSAITIPVLLIQGDSDVVCPVELCGREVKEAIAGAEMVLLEGVNHFPPTEAQDKVTDLIKQHAKRCFG